MIRVELRPFAIAERGKLACEIGRQDRLLRADFHLHEIEDLVFETARKGQRKDDLWRATCFEVFVAPTEERRYLELNAASSGDWNGYLFDEYRMGMREAPLQPLRIRPVIERGSILRELRVEADLSALDFLAEKSWDVAISAVLSRADRIEHWAAAHCASKPDFHDRAAFVVQL